MHILPYNLLTEEATFSLGETLGIVTKPKDFSEMSRGNFMRVRVAVDITKPLCCERKVTWDQSKRVGSPFNTNAFPIFIIGVGIYLMIQGLYLMAL